MLKVESIYFSLVWQLTLKVDSPLQDSEIIAKYFSLSQEQRARFAQLGALYPEWNERINLVSRKDIENLYVNHVLHSLGIAKVVSFLPGADIIDVGTGGGFPGIPLAILFPDANFHLVDSIGKKIKVVSEISRSLGLRNIRAEHSRVETISGKYDFVVSRAVTDMKEFYGWVRNKAKKKSTHPLSNGILYLKGGQVNEELTALGRPFKVYQISDYFEEEYFETKKVVYLPL